MRKVNEREKEKEIQIQKDRVIWKNKKNEKRGRSIINQSITIINSLYYRIGDKKEKQYLRNYRNYEIHILDRSFITDMLSLPRNRIDVRSVLKPSSIISTFLPFCFFFLSISFLFFSSFGFPFFLLFCFSFLFFFLSPSFHFRSPVRSGKCDYKRDSLGMFNRTKFYSGALFVHPLVLFFFPQNGHVITLITLFPIISLVIGTIRIQALLSDIYPTRQIIDNIFIQWKQEGRYVI